MTTGNFDAIRIKEGWFPTTSSPFRPLTTDVKLPGKPSDLGFRQMGNYEAEVFLGFLVYHLKDRTVWEEVELGAFWNALMKKVFQDVLKKRDKEWAVYAARQSCSDAQLGFSLLLGQGLILDRQTEPWFWLTTRLVEYLLAQPHPLDCVG